MSSSQTYTTKPIENMDDVKAYYYRLIFALRNPNLDAGKITEEFFYSTTSGASKDVKSFDDYQSGILMSDIRHTRFTLRSMSTGVHICFNVADNLFGQEMSIWMSCKDDATLGRFDAIVRDTLSKEITYDDALTQKNDILRNKSIVFGVQTKDSIITGNAKERKASMLKIILGILTALAAIATIIYTIINVVGG